MIKISYSKILILLGVLSITCLAQIRPPNYLSPDYIIKRVGGFKKPTLKAKQKKAVSPDEADLRRYADFLRQPGTGLVKLFSDEGCEDNSSIVRADEICLNWIPMSGFYSFRENEHTVNFLSDIRVKDNVLVSDGLLSQGILVRLGDVALDDITLVSDGINFLNAYKPEVQNREALKQTKQLTEGIKSGNHLYRRYLSAEENTTYALRVIAYRGDIIKTYKGEKTHLLAGDDRADITVAFRILKIDESGTLTLLWKELLRKASPKVVFPKPDRKTN